MSLLVDTGDGEGRETTVARDMRTIAEAAWQWDHENGAVAVLAKSSTPTLRVRFRGPVTAPASTLPDRGSSASFPRAMVHSTCPRRHDRPLGGCKRQSRHGRQPCEASRERPVPIRIDDEWRRRCGSRLRRTVTPWPAAARALRLPRDVGTRGPGTPDSGQRASVRLRRDRRPARARRWSAPRHRTGDARSRPRSGPA